MNVIVVGAGSFGSWSALKLQQAGCDVTLVDAWGAGNSRASSGGETRVIRTVYGQDDLYIEMAYEAMDQWDHFQQTVDEKLMEMTGSLWLCGSDDSYVQAAAPKIASLGLELLEYGPQEASSRWSQINFQGLRKVFFEPHSGYLLARKACAVVAQEFVRRGGRFMEDAALPPQIDTECRQIKLKSGEQLDADHIVLAAGPWLGRLLPNVLGNRIEVTRQEVYYFGPPAGCSDFDQSKLPIWLELNEPIYYGIPSIDQRGFKIARDERGVKFDPEKDDRLTTNALLEEAKSYMGRRFPSMKNAPLVESRVCQYANTPDGHFILDRHNPSGLVVVGGGSGHGFKMGPVIGDMVVESVMRNRSYSEFALARLDDSRETSTQFEHS